MSYQNPVPDSWTAEAVKKTHRNSTFSLAAHCSFYFILLLQIFGLCMIKKMQLAVMETVFSSVSQASHVELIHNGNADLHFGKEIPTCAILIMENVE